MKKLAVIAVAAVMALCLAGCSAATQTVEFNGCTFDVPSGEIEKMSDDAYAIHIEEMEGTDDTYAYISWSYSDLSEYKYVGIENFLDADNLEQYQIYDGVDLVCVRSNVEEGYIGAYKTLRFDEVSHHGKAYEDNYRIVHSSVLRAQVHDNTYVTIALYASDKETLDKYAENAEAVFSSVKLV